jgi:RNA recognition motif-containing protein
MSSSIAYVDFNSVEEATKAVEEMNGKEFQGRMIRTDFAGPRRRMDQANTARDGYMNQQ